MKVQIYLNNKAALLKTFDIGDFFSTEAVSQVTKTMSQCIG